MLGLLNPFDDCASHRRHSTARRASHVKPSSGPHMTCSDELEPKVTIDTKHKHYSITVLPRAGVQLDNVRATIGRFQLCLSGTVQTLGSSLYTYRTRRSIPVYDDLSGHDVVGSIPAGALVKGGAPSSRGWIALSDDESWVMNDGRLELVANPQGPARFEREVPMPADAVLSRATSEILANGGLVIRVPHLARAQPRPVMASSTQPTLRPAVSRPTCATEAARATALESTRRTPALHASNEKETPKHRTQPTAATAELPKPATKLVRSSDDVATGPRAGLHNELHKLTSDPVLVEASVSARNVASPTEAVEDWVSLPGGGFKKVCEA